MEGYSRAVARVGAALRALKGAPESSQVEYAKAFIVEIWNARTMRREHNLPRLTFIYALTQMVARCKPKKPTGPDPDLDIERFVKEIGAFEMPSLENLELLGNWGDLGEDQWWSLLPTSKAKHPLYPASSGPDIPPSSASPSVSVSRSTPVIDPSLDSHSLNDNLDDVRPDADTEYNDDLEPGEIPEAHISPVLDRSPLIPRRQPVATSSAPRPPVPQKPTKSLVPCKRPNTGDDEQLTKTANRYLSLQRSNISRSMKDPTKPLQCPLGLSGRDVRPGCVMHRNRHQLLNHLESAHTAFVRFKNQALSSKQKGKERKKILNMYLDDENAFLAFVETIVLSKTPLV
ncbi:unnamed protein product [Peniophora sp. CBMAI 1063]|nr:unnamed protein product [Peniophora sp. CBMAI 1063]